MSSKISDLIKGLFTTDRDIENVEIGETFSYQSRKKCVRVANVGHNASSHVTISSSQILCLDLETGVLFALDYGSVVKVK